MHSRGYLPHLEGVNVPQHLTFRLHDSLPAALLAQLEEELEHVQDLDARAVERRTRIQGALDAGIGECHLKNRAIASIIVANFREFSKTRYQLHAWCVMPNHVHVLITPYLGMTLSGITHSWKSYTAKQANRVLGRSGRFWMPEYFDRFIRSEAHFKAVVEYIQNNPVQAGLCARPEDWEFSSASAPAL